MQKKPLERFIRDYLATQFYIPMPSRPCSSNPEAIIRYLVISARRRDKMIADLTHNGLRFMMYQKSVKDVFNDVVSSPVFHNDNTMLLLSQLLLKLDDIYGDISVESIREMLMKAIDDYIGTSNAQTSRTIESLLPPEFSTPQAMQLWNKAKEAGLVDANFQPIGTLSDAALLADRMGELLGFGARHRWAPFAKLWGIKYLRQRYNDALFLEDYADRVKKIKSAIG